MVIGEGLRGLVIRKSTERTTADGTWRIADGWKRNWRVLYPLRVIFVGKDHA